MQISDVKDAIADAARENITLPAGIGKLTCTGFVPDAVVAPCFFVGEVDVNYDQAMGRGLDELLITCRVLAGRADDRSAQRILDKMLSGSGPASLKAAFETMRGAPGEFALGGLADDIHLQRVTGYRWYEHAGSSYVGAELAVRVIGDGRT
ncbi:hypothetical protein [Streptomyces sp. HGB0020]|uniref:hypothetical protein n=1 Tax=Streptomyces sp. HGB0020 TaxID=1078086 RepID=UPI00034EB540|nr:hypothetical protein [Streptomyces sp. HGB0020]EPD56358.1 hypothetical protein HMPREF1211_07478 [Streptomyces sp. HGB0020]